MTALPDKNHLISGTATEAQFQAAIGALYDYLAELSVGVNPQDLSIDAGSITPTRGFVRVDTENDISADDLTNINFSTLGGKTLFIRSESSSRAVTVKHMAGGSGQIYLANGVDAVLDHQNMLLVLYYNTTNSRWEELTRNFGLLLSSTARTKLLTDLALGTASGYAVGLSSGQIPLNSMLGAIAYKNVIDTVTLLADGLITGAKIADNTITVGKLTAGGSANKLFGTNASGIPSLIDQSAIGQRQLPNMYYQSVAGAYTFSKPAGVTTLLLEAAGGGGGGGMGYNSQIPVAATAGCYVRSYVTVDSGPMSITVVVGAGGARSNGHNSQAWGGSASYITISGTNQCYAPGGMGGMVGNSNSLSAMLEAYYGGAGMASIVGNDTILMGNQGATSPNPSYSNQDNRYNGGIGFGGGPTPLRYLTAGVIPGSGGVTHKVDSGWAARSDGTAGFVRIMY